MKLSKFYTDVPDYLEYGYVCAPNATGQSITANTITKLELNTEVQDFGGHGTLASNEVELQPGVYAWEGWGAFRTTVATYAGGVMSLYDVTNGKYVQRGSVDADFSAANPFSFRGRLSGQIVVGVATKFALRFVGSVNVNVSSGCYTMEASTDSTADADQRVTLKLWKLK